jgi:hypothetical protein
MAEEKKLSGPDFTEGVSLTEFSDGGTLQGHTQGECILVARRPIPPSLSAHPAPIMGSRWPKA